MEGIQYMVDEQGQRTAVVIDLRLYADLWEDLHDSLVLHQRRNDPRESLDEMEEYVRHLDETDGNG